MKWLLLKLRKFNLKLKQSVSKKYEIDLGDQLAVEEDLLSKEIQKNEHKIKARVRKSRKLGKIKSRIVFAVLLAIGVMMVVFIYILIALAYSSDTKQEIIQQVKTITGRDLVIDGNVDFKFLPYPHFTVNGLKLKNKKNSLTENLLAVSSVEIVPSLLYLLLDDIKVTEIILNEPTINLEDFSDTEPNWYFILDNEDTNQKELKNYIDGGVFVFRSPRIFFHSGMRENPVERMVQLRDMNIKADSLSGPFAVNGEFMADTMEKKKLLLFQYDFKIGNLDQEEDTDLSFRVQSGTSYISIKGKYADGTVKAQLDGSIDKSVKSLGNYFGTENSSFPEVISRMFANELITIKGDLSSSKQKTTIQNIAITSSNINGTGRLDVDLGSVNKITVAMDFKTIDLDLLTVENKDELTDLEKKNKDIFAVKDVKKDNYIEFNLPEDVELFFNVNIEKLAYKKWPIDNFNIKAKFDHKNISIYSFNAKNLPGYSQLNWSATPDNKGSFNGELNLSGKELLPLFEWLDIDTSAIKKDALKDFVIDSDISFSDKRVFFKHINVDIDHKKAVGQLLVNKGDVVIGNAALRIGKLNLNDYLADKKEKDSSISTVFAKFDLIRNTNIYVDKLAVSILADEITYGNTTYKTPSGIVRMGGGILQLENVSVNTKTFGKVTGKIEINANNLRPIINADVALEKVNSLILFDLFKKKDQTQDENDDLLQSPNLRWSRESFDFNMFRIFYGKLNFTVGEMTYEDQVLKGLKTSVDIVNGQVVVNSLKAMLFSTRLEMNGYFNTGDIPGVSMVFSASNINVKRMLGTLFGYSKVNGKGSMSGSFSMSGHTYSQWISSMQGNIKVISRQIVANGFDLLFLSRKIPRLTNLKNVRYWAYKILSSGKSIFNYVAGNISIVKGIVSLQNISLMHYVLRSGTLAGEIDLPEWRINAKANFGVKSKKGVFPAKLTINGDINKPLLYWDKKGIEKFMDNNVFRYK